MFYCLLFRSVIFMVWPKKWTGVLKFHTCKNSFQTEKKNLIVLLRFYLFSSIYHEGVWRLISESASSTFLSTLLGLIKLNVSRISEWILSTSLARQEMWSLVDPSCIEHVSDPFPYFWFIWVSHHTITLNLHLQSKNSKYAAFREKSMSSSFWNLEVCSNLKQLQEHCLLVLDQGIIIFFKFSMTLSAASNMAFFLS